MLANVLESQTLQFSKKQYSIVLLPTSQSQKQLVL